MSFLPSVSRAAYVPRYIGAKAYATATQSIPNSAVTPVTFDTEEFDSDGFHDNVTNPSRFTVPAGMAGKYLLVAGCGMAAAGTTWEFGFRINGATLVRGASAAPSDKAAVTAVAALAAGDYVEFWAFQASGGALNIGHASASDVQARASLSFLGA